jgi:hypothetical protein
MVNVGTADKMYTQICYKIICTTGILNKKHIVQNCILPWFDTNTKEADN